MKMNKKIFLTGILLLWGAVCLLAQPVAERCSHEYVSFQGMTREYWMYVPENLPAGAPLMVALHGYGGSALKMKPGLIDLAQEKGFALCCAQGLIDPNGKPSWNCGYPGRQDGWEVDDVAYLEFLVHHLQAKYDLSPHNAFMVGMSNGGEMCYLMAQKKPGVFAAICSMAGLCLYNMLPITYTAPVPFMEVHGTADHTSEWCGDPENKGGWGPYLAVPASVSYVVAAAKSTYYSEEELPVKRHPVLLHKYLGGAPAWEGGPGTEVWLYEVKGGGHSWAEADMDTFHEIWRFCSRYLR